MDVAMLRDNIALELDQAIEWARVDAAYSRIVGGVNLYVPTVLKNLATLQEEEARLAEHIADVALQDFTNPEAIRRMGSLYLRRADKMKAESSIADCQKAYAAFDACRICEQAFLVSQRESATTSFQRARAILLAATISQDPNPFPAYLSGKQSLLHLGESLFQRAVSLSVGDFYKEARRKASEAARLRTILEPAAV